jgi:RNA polymerase sigma-70 factor (ECF subfamily)
MTAPAPTLAGVPFADIYRRYRRDVFGYVFSQTGNRALGEDLTSETFARALRHGCTYIDRGKPVRAWLVTIARNLIRDHNKCAYERTTSLLGADPIPEVVLPLEHADDPERRAVFSELTQRLYAAMRELPGEQRACLYLRFIEGRSVAETAGLLQKNEPAVRALQYRAIRKLRDCLA